MEKIALKSEFNVDLISTMGSDDMICRAARVSTQGHMAQDTDATIGLMRFLMKNRHGSPFEHGGITFRISAPIFVWREFMRHRIGFSYNEQSGRYMKLEPTFYVPGPGRDLIQEGKTGEYRFVPGTPAHHETVHRALGLAYEVAWESYTEMLRVGVANEVARMCLPVSVYSSAYVTCNPRSLMHFLSLRTKHEDSTYPSFPMAEINGVADKMEFIFEGLFPLAHQVFNEMGRVAP